MLYCKHCGTPIHDSDRFCPGCGARIQNRAGTDPIPQGSEQRTAPQPVRYPNSAYQAQPVWMQTPVYASVYMPPRPALKSKIGGIVMIAIGAFLLACAFFTLLYISIFLLALGDLWDFLDFSEESIAILGIFVLILLGGILLTVFGVRSVKRAAAYNNRVMDEWKRSTIAYQQPYRPICP